MNKNGIKGVIFLMFLAGVFWIFVLRSDSESEKNSRREPSSRVLKGDLYPKTQIILDDEGAEKPSGMADEDWNRALRVHAIKESANQTIEFYGKIIDQNGEPVQGVNLELELFKYDNSFLNYLVTGEQRVTNSFTLTTDSEGLFVLKKKKGTSLVIEKMTKEGYVSSDRGVKNHFTYGNISSGNASKSYHIPDEARPIIYKMWKKGNAEPLIKTGVRLRIKPDEGVREVYYPFVLRGRSSPVPVEGWDIKVSGRNETAKKRREDDYWEVTLTAGEGGGLVIADDSYANFAPEEGYHKSITFKSIDYQDSSDDPIWRAYYRGANGNKYAAFRFRFSFGGKNSKGAFSVFLENLRINPNGSRNLEYDELKRIK